MEPAPGRAKTRKPEEALQSTRQSPGLWPETSSNGLHGPGANRLAPRQSTLALCQSPFAQRQPGIEVGHHVVESLKVQRLLTVAPGLVRVGMNQIGRAHV